EGVGYNAIPPPAADLYLSSKKDLSWTGLPKFVDDTVTDYSMPSPTVASTSAEGQNKDTSTSKNVASPNPPKPFVKFVKPKDNNLKRPKGNQRIWNNLKSYQVGLEFVLHTKPCFNYGDFSHLANDCRRRVQRETTRSQNHTYKSPSHRSGGHRPHGGPMRPPLRYVGHRPHGTSMRPSNRPAGHRPHGGPMRPPLRYVGHRPHGTSMRPSNRPAGHRPHVKTLYRAPWVPTVNRNTPPVNRKFSTGRRNFPTVTRKLPTASKEFTTGSIKNHTADMGRKGKANNIDDKGYWDSGCSRHMTGNISYLSDFEPFDGGYVSFGQGGCMITGKGTNKISKLEFENVYFIRDLKYNMFSVLQICDNKNSVLFTNAECIMLERNFKLFDDANILLRTPRQHIMYSIDLNNIVPHKDLTCLVAKASADECILWHMRLCHLNVKIMNKLVRHNLVRGLPTKSFDNDHTCTACLKGKQHKASCKSKLVNSMTKPLHTLHMDLFGHTSVGSISHKWYCFVVTDDFSRFTWTFFLRSKDETSDILKKFITKIENLKDLKVKIIRVLVNKSQNKTPYGLFNGRTPAIGFLKPFGYHVMILNTLYNLGKFEAKGDEGYFIRYSMSSKAFRVFNKRTRKVEENLHVEFLENKAIKKGAGPNWLFDIGSLTKSMNYVPVDVGTNSTNLSESSSSKPHDESSSQVPKGSGNPNPTASSSNPSTDQMETLTVESPILTVSSLVPTYCLNDSLEPSSKARLISKRVANQEETPSLDNILLLTNRIHKDHPKSQIIGPVDTPIQTRHKSKMMEEQSFTATIHQKTDPTLLQFCLFSCFLSQVKPKKVSDALQDPSWMEAMVKPIGTKWVLKNKKDEIGIVVRNKARLVAQGHTQEEGIDYDEVFAPVARIEAIRLFLAYASFMGFTVYHMDVKSAFLYGTIGEEVYVMQPLGFQDPAFPAKLYREFEALMHEKFQMSAMGELNFFLGLQVLQKEDGIFLSQDKYIGDILNKFGFLNVRSSNTLMDKENPWGKDETGKDVELHLYRSMIGSLMYRTASRPDIMFAVCAYARHQVIPKECHLHVVKRIFRYLKGHPKLGLWYPKASPFDLVAYSDSDYGGVSQDCKSTTGGSQFLGRRFRISCLIMGTNSTNFSGTTDVARQEVKKDVSSLRYIALPNWIHEVHLESSLIQPQDTCNSDAPESSGNSNPTTTSTNPPADQLETLTMNTLKIKPEPEDVNIKFLRGLPPSWSSIALILKTKRGLKYISFDDMYNKLKFLEIDTKGYSSSPSTLSNASFVSTTGSSQGNLSY
nr:hypothetical protein [Tanacetum cinerariifolium]